MIAFQILHFRLIPSSLRILFIAGKSQGTGTGLSLRLVCFFFLLFCCNISTASDSILTYTYTEDTEESISFRDSLELIVDYEMKYTIEDILQQSDKAFIHPENTQLLKVPAVSWTRVKIVNNSSTDIQNYFRLSPLIYQIWVYTIKDDKVTNTQKSGTKVKPAQKLLYDMMNDVPFHLEPNETKVYYFKIRYEDESSLEFQRLNGLSMIHGKTMIQERLRFVISSFFYIGALFLFALVGVFMYYMFREKIFIYFAVMMLFFTLFFLQLSQCFYYFFNLTLDDYRKVGFWLNLVNSGLFFSLFLFISTYLQLPKRMPKYFRFFLIITLLIVTFRFVLTGDFMLNQVGSILNLIWAISCMVPAILLARKKDKSARILLLSIFAFFISAIILFTTVLLTSSMGTFVISIFQFGVFSFSSILFYGLFDRVNTIRSEKQRFEELDQLKSRFFANISHEFRTPLTLILGPTKDLQEQLKKPQQQELLNVVYRNGERLLQLVNQLLDLSKLEAKKLEFEAQELDIIPYLEGILLSFRALAEQRNIELKFKHNTDSCLLYIDQEKIEKVFYNLLSNALKFMEDNGRITLVVKERSKNIEIRVLDTGIGISEEHIGQVFDRFYQGDASTTRDYEGTGIGLALVKELVELHQGTIKVASTPNEGTIFTMVFKKGKEHLRPEDIKTDVPALVPVANSIPALTNSSLTNALSSQGKDTPTQPAENAPLVLIVEDNEDVRYFVRQSLQDKYQVLEAENGQIGIEKALEHIPDIIISDVMMPQKNGYELCDFLKNDERTSHIPIILLTAKADTASKMEGLRKGADVYLPKPFDKEELLLRLEKMTQRQQKLKAYFSKNINNEPTAIPENLNQEEKEIIQIEHVFIEKVKNIIAEHYSDEQFALPDLCDKLHISRSQLYRKMKALIDVSPSRFIRTYRLQEGKKLLETTELTVTEVAWQVGFKEQSHFSKAFNNEFGYYPTENGK